MGGLRGGGGERRKQRSPAQPAPPPGPRAPPALRLGRVVLAVPRGEVLRGQRLGVLRHEGEELVQPPELLQAALDLGHPVLRPQGGPMGTVGPTSPQKSVPRLAVSFGQFEK